MADKNNPRNVNAKGNFFVDNTCIDCGTCYWIAPSTYQRNNGMSAVYHQPTEEKGEMKALQALFSCPTNSIGTFSKSDFANQVVESFPFPVAENVYHTGFHSEDSYGATSYYIKREEGNILVDSPRFTQKLTQKFSKMGGVQYQLLSHRDDIADTNKYHDEFKGHRIIHEDDKVSNSENFEQFLSGDSTTTISGDVISIPVPGHTKGSVVYLYKEKFLFTGDHLAFSRELGHLYAFKTACWYDWETQIKSMERLLKYSFEYVLPGHGAPVALPAAEMKSSLEKCIKWMKS